MSKSPVLSEIGKQTIKKKKCHKHDRLSSEANFAKLEENIFVN
jgi:hypothetical protein